MVVCALGTVAPVRAAAGGETKVGRTTINGRQLSGLNSRRPLDAALAYAELGWRVFPVAPLDRGTGRCGCRDGGRCDQVAKHPLVRWADQATTDAGQVREWWGRWKPEANIGVATGERSALVVVDIDRQHAGMQTRSRLAEQGLVFPPTLAARTRSGGWHFFYQAPPGRRVCNTEGELAGVGKTPGIDVRGDGGYVIVAPSVRPGLQGGVGRYEWVAQDLVPAPAPGWVTVPKPAPPRQAAGPETTRDPSRRAEAALDREVARIADAGEGDRNKVLFQAAANLFEIVNTGFLAEQRVRAELTSAAVAAGLGEREVRHTLDAQWRRKQGVRRAGWAQGPGGQGQGRMEVMMRSSRDLGLRPDGQLGWGR